jgi:hypothetical protein
MPLGYPNLFEKKKPSFLGEGKLFMDKLFSRKRYIDKYDAGGNYFYERRANTATPPHYASNNKPCWEMKMAVNKNPTPINISYSVGVATLNLRFFNCS